MSAKKKTTFKIITWIILILFVLSTAVLFIPF